MKKEGFSAAGITAVIALFCFCGDSGTNATVEQPTTVPIASLRLDSTSVPGWADSFYVTGDTSQVFDAIDGGAIVDIQKGMRYFSRQEMENGTHSAKLDIFDFVTVQASKNMFSYTAKNTGALPWRSYSPTSAVITNSPYYTVVTAQINKYYFELTFAVENDDTVFTEASANSFYNKFVTLLK